MMKLGEKQTLTIDRVREFGVYLTDGTDSVLLPKKEVPEGAARGDSVEVFLYKDSSDRLIATTAEPLVTLHRAALLTVREVTKIGAFLDWGLTKDLLLPFHEQTRKVKAGETVLAALYVDKSDRLAATMNVYPYLSKESPYKTGDQVTGVVYETSRNFGAFVAVDSMFSALIPKRELVRDLKVGDVVSARVTAVKPDGKLDLSIREKAPLQMDRDMDRIMNRMKDNGGFLPFNDRVAPEIIRLEMQMSKNEFKRAVGHLLKLGKIEIGSDAIRMKQM
jgi:predicted RNA-binding protein (virulence factor B family)